MWRWPRYNRSVPIPPADLPPAFYEPPPVVDVARYIVEPPEWAETPEPAPVLGYRELREANAWTAWTSIAIAEITLLVAEVRERGAANLAEVLERVNETARRFEASSLEVARAAQNAKTIVGDLQRNVGPSVESLPELREQYENQVEDMKRRAAILQVQAEAFYPVLKAYQEALQVLVAIQDGSIPAYAEQPLKWASDQAGDNNYHLPTLGAVAQVIGPVLGATLLLGFIHPAAGLLIGAPIGLFVGVARYREGRTAR